MPNGSLSVGKAHASASAQTPGSPGWSTNPRQSTGTARSAARRRRTGSSGPAPTRSARCRLRSSASHAALAGRALDAGKAVFVEKPPVLTLDGLDRLEAAAGRTGLPLMASFNRRHAPLAFEMCQHVRSRGRFCLTFRVNAGRLPDDHWLNDLDDGGGRLLGEGCHFVDFACWMVGVLPDRVSCSLAAEPDRPLAAGQSFAVTLTFEDASLATVVYCAAGADGVPKERIEVHARGRSAILNDFRTLTLSTGAARDRDGPAPRTRVTGGSSPCCASSWMAGGKRIPLTSLHRCGSRSLRWRRRSVGSHYRWRPGQRHLTPTGYGRRPASPNLKWPEVQAFMAPRMTVARERGT
jgi:hypothetical protein